MCTRAKSRTPCRSAAWRFDFPTSIPSLPLRTRSAAALLAVADYYYYPGWHEPGSTLEIIINKDAYESLPQDLKAVIKYAARAANQEMLDEYTAQTG